MVPVRESIHDMDETLPTSTPALEHTSTFFYYFIYQLIIQIGFRSSHRPGLNYSRSEFHDGVNVISGCTLRPL